MSAHFATTLNGQQYRVVSPLPLSAAHDRDHFIAQFISLHQQDTLPILVHQLMTIGLPNTTAEFWIVYNDEYQPVACASANTAIFNKSVGYVGLFEAKNEQAGTQVLNIATEWLRKGGENQFEPVKQVYGPINMTTWLQYRLRVDAVPQAPMSFEPNHPVFYQNCFAQAGFVKAVDFYACFFNIDQLIDRVPLYANGETFERMGVRVEPWNTLDFPASLYPEKHPELTPRDNVAKRLYDLSFELFRGKEFFDEAFSREYHRKMVLNDIISRPEVDNASFLDLSTFMVDEATGKDVGYLACWVENKDTLVMKTIGFVPSFRKTKAFSIIIPETSRRAKEVWGCTKVVLALMNENTTSMTDSIGGKNVRHVYRLYTHNPNSKAASQAQGQASTKRVTIAATAATVTTALDVSYVPSINEQTQDQLQRRQQELRSQMYWRQQHSTRLAERSSQAMARL
ncbi:hypothetical protein BGZ65_003926 [Modicella reniformis]|uniref:N-acetyltransferase domain-containing protein n=1 Tax=Modicella reniformis TaxID=1440133 RepID=A0A9P6LSJ2_9FUNG|nr:hypothetical protein BGZ65_003926 [Modicella reniformis]